ncbi:MAG: cytidine deaminase [Bacilli bacterium]|nr:cytidine deaminase [Bacilli bacterium]
MNDLELAQLAKEARRLSYSPYSNFAVGAVVVTKDGTVYEGANIENSAFGLCMCGERNAIFNAYLHEVKKDDIVALALCADTKGPCSPCGQCRQVMSELLPYDCRIVMSNLKGDMKVTSVEELLPFAFTGDEL